ncbi:hypothetical protein [Rubeoparvulum massiliense]|uniref:hypothetical protein n=1 Tax=Rubeoparvulum massiliense TaxID=1631346 RepID=UPI00065E6CC7|nr:hypothetical protein [Rubeoparvulum massiliense]
MKQLRSIMMILLVLVIAVSVTGCGKAKEEPADAAVAETDKQLQGEEKQKEEKQTAEKEFSQGEIAQAFLHWDVEYEVEEINDLAQDQAMMVAEVIAGEITAEKFKAMNAEVTAEAKELLKTVKETPIELAAEAVKEKIVTILDQYIQKIEEMATVIEADGTIDEEKWTAITEVFEDLDEQLEQVINTIIDEYALDDSFSGELSPNDAWMAKVSDAIENINNTFMEIETLYEDTVNGNMKVDKYRKEAGQFYDHAKEIFQIIEERDVPTGAEEFRKHVLNITEVVMEMMEIRVHEIKDDGTLDADKLKKIEELMEKGEKLTEELSTIYGY